MGRKIMGNPVTPLHIEIALHYYRSRESHQEVFKGQDKIATATALQDLADAGLLEISIDNRKCQATDAMSKYIETLCSLRFPVKQQVNSSDRFFSPDIPFSKSGKFIGDETINTRNLIIAEAMDEYLASTPQSRF